MYNELPRKSIFPKNLVNEFSQISTLEQIEIPPVFSADTKEIIEVDTIATNNIILNDNQTINGFTTISGSVVLVIGQSDKKENGVYIADSADWSKISNDLNDISLFIVTNGDFNGYGYQVVKPVEDGENVEFINLWNNEGSIILSNTIEFDGADVASGIATYFELMAGVTGKCIDIISGFLELDLTSVVGGSDILINFENGSDPIYTIPNATWTGTGVVKRKVIIPNPINLTQGNGIGFNHPTLTYTSGTLIGKLHLTYRLI